jgi:ribose transport system substrate-binding protein
MVILLALVVVMAASLLYGCAPKTVDASPSVAPSVAPSPAAPVEPPSNPSHEVYKLMEANMVPWQGLFTAETASRAAIEKAIKPDNKAEGITVGYVTWNNTNPFFAISEKYLKEQCESWGYKFVSLCSNGDLNAQIADIESLVTSGVDVIIDCDYSVEAELPAIQAAVDAGIPVIGYGLVFPADSPVITTSACPYYEQGWVVGRYVADFYKNDKDLISAAIPGMMGHPIGESAINGYLGGFVYERALQGLGKPFATKEDAMLYGYNLLQEIAKNASFKDAEYGWSIVQSIDGFWSEDGGLTAMEDILTGHPDLEFVWTCNDSEGFGAIKAMENAGFKVGTDIQIASIGDGMEDALTMIKEGTYLCTALASPYTYVGTCANLVHKIFAEGFDATNLPHGAYLPLVLVTKDNVDEWLAKVSEEYTVLPDVELKPIS